MALDGGRRSFFGTMNIFVNRYAISVQKFLFMYKDCVYDKKSVML